jgi:dTMP kinase
MTGAFIALEGPDGTGKTNQVERLAEKLREEGYPVVCFDFPQYEDNVFGKTVGRFLSGEFGTLESQSPYLASMLFSGDRWLAGPKIKKAISEGNIVISNRYFLSNFAHQGAKIREDKREDFLQFLRELEYETYAIPKEDLNIILHIPPEISQSLIEEKARRTYLAEGLTKDIQESDLEYQMEVSKIYRETIPQLLGDKALVIDCAPEGKLMTIDEIHPLIWREVENFIHLQHEGRICGERQR